MKKNTIVLLISDDVAVHAVTASALGRRCRLQSSVTLGTAVAAVRARPPALVILDDALTAAESVAVLETLQHLPRPPAVLLIAGEGEARVLEATGGRGVVGVLPRPVRPDGLLRALEAAAQHVRPLAGWRLHRAVREAIGRLAANLVSPTRLPQLAAAVGISPRYLSYLFRRDVGVSPRPFVLRLRLEAARYWLETSDDKLETIAERAGFCDVSHLSRTFLDVVGVRPGEYRRATARQDARLRTADARRRPIHNSRRCVHCSEGTGTPLSAARGETRMSTLRELSGATDTEREKTA